MKRRSAAALVLLGCARSEPRQATVDLAAAVSLKAPLEAVAHDYERAHPGVRIRLSLGASGDLERQVAAGAATDLFASATTASVLRLGDAGVATSTCTLATNRLVLVRRNVPDLADVTWSNLASHPAIAHVALGLAATVPAGAYAEEALRSLGVLDDISARLVRGGNVRQVLAFVARGEADVGFVYATDVASSDGVVVVGEPPPHARPRVSYPLLTTSTASVEARAFAAELCGASARQAFLRHGFGAP